MNPDRERGAALEALIDRLGVMCEDPSLLETALAHRSFTFERRDVANNERLEFLGDAVLGLVVTDMIFAWFPELAEGDMAKLRSSTVNMAVLADVARSIGLGQELLLGKGEELSGGRNKDSILADALEAVLGALYLECGLDQIRTVIDRLFASHIHQLVDRGVVRDFKTNLQELSVHRTGALPEYRICSAGPDHDKRFQAEVYLNGDLMGSGTGSSKKLAEQAAAKEALTRLTDEAEPGDARAT